MNFKKFISDNKKILIIVGLIIIAFIIYRYFLQKHNILSDLNLKNSNRNNIFSKRICLDSKTQQQIANDINKKLQEINACDCADTCNNKINAIAQIKSSIDNNIKESFGNDDFY